MFHKIKNVAPLPGFKLSVQFAEGVTKLYDASALPARISAFRRLETHPDEFSDVRVDIGGHGIVWSDDLDLSCDELWENGKAVETPFDGLMALSDATVIWG